MATLHSPAVSNDFGSYLDGLLKARDLSGRAFDRIVSTGQGFVNQVIRGEAPPPMDRLDAWAEALVLSDEERAEFFTLAKQAKALAKADIRDEVESLYADVKESHGIIMDLSSLVLEFRRQLPAEFARRASEILGRAKP